MVIRKWDIWGEYFQGKTFSGPYHTLFMMQYITCYYINLKNSEPYLRLNNIWLLIPNLSLSVYICETNCGGFQQASSTYKGTYVIKSVQEVLTVFILIHI